VGHLSVLPRASWWLPSTALLTLLSGEWLRTSSPGLVPAIVLTAAAVVLLLPWRRGPGAALVVAWVAVTLPLAIGATAHRRALLARGVPSETTRQASRILAEAGTRLDRLERQLDLLALTAATLRTEPREAAFDEAEARLSDVAPEAALAIVGPSGTPLVWAGVHRLPVTSGSVGVSLRQSSFYSVLEVRRQREGGGMAIASALLSADTLLTDPPASLAGRLRSDLGADISLRAAEAGAGGSWPERNPVLAITVDQLTPDEAVLRLMSRAGPVVGVLLVALVAAAIAATAAPAARLTLLALVPWLALRTPLDRALGLEAFVSPATFFSPLLGPLSASAGTLAVTGGLLFVLGVAAWHRGIRRHPGGLVLAGGLLLAAPYLLREFGRGITPPAAGVPPWLWLTWHFTLLITAAAMLTAAAALARGESPSPRSWPALVGGGLGILAAWIGVLAYTGRPAWPTWYTALWLPGILLAARPATRRATIFAVGCIAGSGATLMTWGAALTGRTDVAIRDVGSLGSSLDPVVEPLLAGFAESLRRAPPSTATGLFRAWRASPLWRDGLPSRLTLWEEGRPAADVVMDRLAVPDSVLARLASAAPEGTALSTMVFTPGVHYIATVRVASGHAITVAVGPRSQLIPEAPLGRVIEPAPDRRPLYRLSLASLGPGQDAPRLTGWRREGWALRSVRPVVIDGQPFEANAQILLGRPGSLFVRGALLLLLDIVVIWVLWLLAERINGVGWRWPDFQRVAGSYRGRLAIALSVFFVAPAAVLASVSIRQLTAEAAQSRDLVLQRILRDAAPAGGLAGPDGHDRLVAQARQVDADLAWYAPDGRLLETSDPVLREVGIFPSQLDASVYHAIHLDGDLTAAPQNPEGALRTGYAALTAERDGLAPVLATVGIARDPALRERQLDVGFTLVLITLLGILAAIASARAAARALSRPVADLRDAALAFGMGRQVPPPRRLPPEEIAPVFDAFDRMAADVRAGQEALERARRQTERVLATVSTGVAALDPDGRVILVNAQAASTPGMQLQEGVRLEAALTEAWAPLAAEAARVRHEGGDGSVEVDVGTQRFAVRLASLASEPGGMVIAVTDVTEATQAARVLAWAELANQVAHAIKNPLTPLRLGIQHLQRVREKQPEQLAETMASTSARILAEIDRLDAIARAFSRFAAPAEPASPLEAVEVAAAFEEVAGLYRMVPDMTLRTDAAPGERVLARRDELAEVLLNLCDNARNAGARVVEMTLSGDELEVRDNGRGIAPEHLSRIFEPRFSTTSSGSGLGLAIVRRLVEGWGGTVGAEAAPGGGAVFRIRFQRPG